MTFFLVHLGFPEKTFFRFQLLIYKIHLYCFYKTQDMEGKELKELSASVKKLIETQEKQTEVIEKSLLVYKRELKVYIDERMKPVIRDLLDITVGMKTRLPALNCINNEERISTLEKNQASMEKDIKSIYKNLKVRKKNEGFKGFFNSGIRS